MNPFQRKALSVLACLAVVGCGGGGGGGGAANVSPTTTGQILKGAALDAPIPQAQITITAYAPLGDPQSQAIGTTTADNQGDYQITGLSLPAGSIPIFANAVDPTLSSLVLTSYLGSANALSSLSGTLSDSELPDLDISPVTTAALAVYAQSQTNGYAGLTPTLYSQTLLNDNSTVLAIATAIKAVGDQLCAPSPTAITQTTNLASQIASQALANPTSSPMTLAGTLLGGNCPAQLANVAQRVLGDPIFGPELQLGDVIDANISSPVAPGTYFLQGLVAELGINQSTGVSLPPAPPSLINDATVIVSATGQITSTDGRISGTLTGNFLMLTVQNSHSAPSYTFRGKIGNLPATVISASNTAAYAIRAQGVAPEDNSLTQFAAVLVPTATVIAPQWSAVQTHQSSESNSCQSGSWLLNLQTLGPNIGGGQLAECVQPLSTGWAMSSAAHSTDSYFNDNNMGTPPSPPVFSAPNWTAVANEPFILASNASYTGPQGVISGTAYYVLGADALIFSTSAPAAVSNSLIKFKDAHLAQWSEGNSSNQIVSTDNGGQKVPGADH